MNPEREPTDRGTGPSGTGTDETADGEAPSLATRATLVFAAPGRLFDALRENPAWIGMLALVVALSMLSAFLVPQEAYVEAFLSQAPPDAPEEAVRDQAELFFRLRYPIAVVAPLVIVTVVAGVLLFVFNVILAGRASFTQLFSGSAHAFLIPAVGGLLTIPIIRATGDVQSTLALHLLVPWLEEGFLFRLLQGMNVFSLWACVVLGIGMSRLYPEREPGGAVATVLGLYLAWKLAGAVLGGLAA